MIEEARLAKRASLSTRLCSAMGNTWACVQQSKGVRLADPSKLMGGSSESVDVTALSKSRVETEAEEGESSWSGWSVEEQIEQSKTHWSERAEFNDSEGEEEAEASNVKEFEELQRHPAWGDFFLKFNQGGGRSTMKMGEKFAEGGQAELFHCHVKWANPKANEDDLKNRTKWVLKVFKKGTFLHQLKSQFPEGLLQFHAAHRKNYESPAPKLFPRYQSSVYGGTLLEDGRFAFLMRKEHFDLRHLIERNMKSKGGKGGGPFSKEEGEVMIYMIALGVEWLHNHGIVHRDLKASNVLVHEYKSCFPKWWLHIADYECSVGVVGTGFFRAPKILQACKDNKIEERPEVFSRAADIYSYGMTCYEILTGKLPFEDYPHNDYTHVLNGNRLMLPEDVEEWMSDMLVRCWQSNPRNRPTIGDILDILTNKSVKVRERKVFLISQYGENFRWKYEFENIINL